MRICTQSTGQDACTERRADGWEMTLNKRISERDVLLGGGEEEKEGWTSVPRSLQVVGCCVGRNWGKWEGKGQKSCGDRKKVGDSKEQAPQELCEKSCVQQKSLNGDTEGYSE